MTIGHRQAEFRTDEFCGPTVTTMPLLTLLVSIALLTNCSSCSDSAIGSKRGAPVGDVPTRKIERGELVVSVFEQGTLESSANTEIKCRVRGDNTILWVVDSGTIVEEGQELLRLETLLIEEEISERTKFAFLSEAEVAQSRADVARARLAIDEYVQGRFVTEMAMLEKDRAIAGSSLLNARNALKHTRTMVNSEYATELMLDQRLFAVDQADLSVKQTESEIDILKRFTKREELATLDGALKAAEAQHEANVEQEFADKQRLKRAEEELEYCVIKAERSGMVIYPRDKEWGDAPDIEEGATVHKDQTLLLMPDLTRMQVKVGIHESVVDRVRNGLPAFVRLPGKRSDGEENRVEGTVDFVASVAKPAGWWTGNVVKYDTVVKLPQGQVMNPGMSVEVEVELARYPDVLLIPTSAVLDTHDGHACWVQTGTGFERRILELGDSNDMFIAVQSGLEAGLEVVLDPLAYLEEARIDAAQTLEAGQSGNQISSR